MEYKILEGAASDVQKILNQWRHQYSINVLGISTIKAEYTCHVTVLLTRTPKGD